MTSDSKAAFPESSMDPIIEKICLLEIDPTKKYFIHLVMPEKANHAQSVEALRTIEHAMTKHLGIPEGNIAVVSSPPCHEIKVVVQNANDNT